MLHAVPSQLDARYPTRHNPRIVVVVVHLVPRRGSMPATHLLRQQVPDRRRMLLVQFLPILRSLDLLAKLPLPALSEVISKLRKTLTSSLDSLVNIVELQESQYLVSQAVFPLSRLVLRLRSPSNNLSKTVSAFFLILSRVRISGGQSLTLPRVQISGGQSL